MQGDTCNLIGLLLAGDQLPTMTYTAMCAPRPVCLAVACTPSA